MDYKDYSNTELISDLKPTETIDNRENAALHSLRSKRLRELNVDKAVEELLMCFDD